MEEVEEEEELPGLRLCGETRSPPGALGCGERSEGRGRETCLEHLCRAQFGPGGEGGRRRERESQSEGDSFWSSLFRSPRVRAAGLKELVCKDVHAPLKHQDQDS